MFRGVAGRSPALGVGAYARSCRDARSHVSQRAHNAVGGVPLTPTYHTVCAAFLLKNLMVIIAQTGENGVNVEVQVYSFLDAQVVNDE